MNRTRIKQRDITDCGASCLASVAAFYHLHMSVPQIRQLASTDKKGTSVLGMVQAATRMGFEAKGVRGNFDSLQQIPLPAIAHVVINHALQHYQVVNKVNDEKVTVMDPACGDFRHYPRAEFEKIWSGVLIILQPGSSFRPMDRRISTFKRFWSLLRPHRGALVIALIGALAYTVIGLSQSFYVQKIVDEVLTGKIPRVLNSLSILMILLLAFQVLMAVLRSVITVHTGQAMDRQLILGYYHHLLRLPQSFFDTMRVGEILSRINDAVKIRTFINDASLHIVLNLLIVLFSFTLMFMFHVKLALYMMLILPAYLAIYFITNRLNKSVERRLMEQSAELEAQLVESLTSITTLKSLGLEEFSQAKTENRFNGVLRIVNLSALNSIFSINSTEALSRLFTILVLWLGAGYVLQTEITTGELLSFYTLVAYFTMPASNLIGMNKVAQNARIAADRLFEIMDLERESIEGMKLTNDMLGNIRFHDVHFSYGTRTPVFEGLSLTIREGSVTAIVGESGCGKSTLVSLLLKLHHPHSGHVMLGDKDIRMLTNQSVREIVGVVPQHIHLFAGTVTENIATGISTPDLNKVKKICADLGLSSFIEQLPSGYDTWLGENGATLSGGERQRIAIARALYRDPEILVLDEATSSLDSSSELYVRSVIRIMKEKSKTVILIAHRLGTILDADRIIVLHSGRVAEEGTHYDLIGLRGVYYGLWRMQFPEDGMGKSLLSVDEQE